MRMMYSSHYSVAMLVTRQVMEASNSCEPFTKKSKQSRRVWSRQEEAALIVALKELVANGWRVDNAFRAGYLSALEKKMSVAFPGTDLRAEPHINSRLTTWKKVYAHLYTLMSTKGASLDPGNHMIIVESQDLWDKYSKIHPDVEKLRYKPFPFYNDWFEIFGNDRAMGEKSPIFVKDRATREKSPVLGKDRAMWEKTPICVKDQATVEKPPGFAKDQPLGENAQGLADVVQELLDSGSISRQEPLKHVEIEPAPIHTESEQEDDVVSVTQPGKSSSTEKAKAKRKRKSLETGPIAVPKQFMDMMGAFMRDTKDAFGALTRKLTEAENSSSSEKKDVLKALQTIPGLQEEHQITLAHRLVQNKDERELFFSMKDHMRAKYVHMLLHGHLR